MKKSICFVVIAVLVLSFSFPAFAADKGYEKGNSSVITWTDSIGTQYALSYCEIVNTSGKPLYCNSGKIELETASGALVKSSDLVSCYPQIIEPGETGYYAECFMLEKPVSEDLTLYCKPKAEPAKVKNIRLDVTDVSFEDSMFGINARGRIRNETGEDLDGMIYVAILLYDKNDQFMGYFLDILTEDLEDGDRTSFETSSFDIKGGISAADIGHFVAFAYPYQFQF